MPLVVSEAIVLHGFDYLESSRIVRLVTRDAGMRSAVARGARKSRRRFGSGLDVFTQGTAYLHTKPGRELDTLSSFEDVRPRTLLGADLERFTGAEAIAEIALRFGREGADAELFHAIAAALDGLLSDMQRDPREATISGVWHIVEVLGFGPSMMDCAECGTVVAEAEAATFNHAAGGALCPACAALSSGGRKLPAVARSAIASWLGGGRVDGFTDADARAHQRLLREFLGFHLHDGGARALQAFEVWESASWSAA